MNNVINGSLNVMYVHVSICLPFFAYGCVFFSFAMIVVLA